MILRICRLSNSSGFSKSSLMAAPQLCRYIYFWLKAAILEWAHKIFWFEIHRDVYRMSRVVNDRTSRLNDFGFEIFSSIHEFFQATFLGFRMRNRICVLSDKRKLGSKVVAAIAWLKKIERLSNRRMSVKPIGWIINNRRSDYFQISWWIPSKK